MRISLCFILPSKPHRYSYRSKDDSRSVVVRLESGDVLLFGGDSRMIYHGVSRVHRGTAPKPIRDILRPGRLNLTFRQVDHNSSSSSSQQRPKSKPPSH